MILFILEFKTFPNLHPLSPNFDDVINEAALKPSKERNNNFWESLETACIVYVWEMAFWSVIVINISLVPFNNVISRALGHSIQTTGRLESGDI